jgi:hypothetical protein
MIPAITATHHEAVCPLMSWHGEGLRYCDSDCALINRGYDGWAACSLGHGHASVLSTLEPGDMPVGPEITDDGVDWRDRR